MSTLSAHSPVYSIRSVPLLRPFTWLSKGWDDLLHHWVASLAYGLLVSGLGLVTLSYQRHPVFVATAITAFMLMGPIVAAGLCELSRRRERHETANFDTSLKTLRPHHDSLLGVANRLVIISAAWFIISYLIIQAALEMATPGMAQTTWGDVLYQLSGEQVAAYVFSGGVLAVIVFVLSVVAVPMIIDKNVDAGTAIRTSVRAAWKDFPSMLVWAALITVLVIVGFATFLVGMVVIFPLLGHATWYAYRDLVKQE